MYCARTPVIFDGTQKYLKALSYMLSNQSEKLMHLSASSEHLEVNGSALVKENIHKHLYPFNKLSQDLKHWHINMFLQLLETMKNEFNELLKIVRFLNNAIAGSEMLKF